MTLRKTTLSIMTFSIRTLSIRTLSIRTLSTTILSITIKIQRSVLYCVACSSLDYYTICHYVEC
jgi:hypothetical protein